MKWEEVEENVGAQFERLCERLLNSLAAQLRSWTRHRQDSEKNAKWTSKHWCSAFFLYIFSPLSSPLLVFCSVSVYFWAVLVLYIPSCRHASFMLLSSWILSYIFSSLSQLIFFLFFPLPLSHWAVVDTVYISWILRRKDICACISICERVYVSTYKHLFSHWASSDWTALVLFS